MRSIILLLLFCYPLVSNASNIYQTKVRLIEAALVDREELLSWKDDLLFPHLYEQWLSLNIKSTTQTEINAFLDNPDYRGAAWFLTPKWQQELIRRKDWQAIHSQFSNEPDADLICYYLESEKQLNLPLSTAKIEELWASGLSRPDHCDPFFIDWITSNDRAEQLIWDRQLKAFYSRNGTLLTYLNRFYTSKTGQDIGKFLTEVYQNPKRIVSQQYNPDKSHMRELALAAVNRMAFQDPRSASNLWLQVVKATPGISATEVRAASKYLGIAMAKQALPEAAYWLTIADPSRKDEQVQHWRLQIALSEKNYEFIVYEYEKLDRNLQNEPQWQYWYGVAKLKTEGTVSADNPLISLSTRRLYYGYLAAGVLGLPPSLDAKPNYPVVTTTKLNAMPELKRAKKLYESGDTVRAQVEWNLVVRNLDNATQHAAAELAMEWNWYAKASQAAGWSGRYDLIELRYPNAYQAIVNAQSTKLDLPNYWLYGVMRQESRYETTAVSPAGAQGLMQIMPNTAKQVAKKLKVPYSNPSDLHDPNLNIIIGSQYLSELLKRFGHPVYATAAYNAGPSRVDLWRDRFPNDISVWIESIPFDETRNYVKSVLAYSQIYALTANTGWHLASWTNPTEGFATLDK